MIGYADKDLKAVILNTIKKLKVKNYEYDTKNYKRLRGQWLIKCTVSIKRYYDKEPNINCGAESTITRIKYSLEGLNSRRKETKYKFEEELIDIMQFEEQREKNTLKMRREI